MRTLRVVASIPVNRRRLTILVAPIAVLVVMSYVGTALAPTLVLDHPLWLLGLDSRNRHLVLVAAQDVQQHWYYLIGFTRLLVSDPLFYLLGREYGDVGLRWVEKQTGGKAGTMERWVERISKRGGFLLVALAPNNLICALAGSARMAPVMFFALNVGGTVVRLAVIWQIGDVFSDALDPVFDFLREYRTPLLIASVLLVVVQVSMARRRGSSELSSIDEIEDQFEAAAAEVEAERGDKPGAPPSP